MLRPKAKRSKITMRTMLLLQVVEKMSHYLLRKR
jgi:hypothetical protein